MTSLSAYSLNGSSIEANLSDAEYVYEVQDRIAIHLGKPRSKVKLVMGDRVISNDDKLADLGSAFTVVLEGNTCFHAGKEVTLFAGTTGTMAEGARCIIYYADGSKKECSGYNHFDSLIEEFGFIRYTSFGDDPYSGGVYECFEAVPPGNASEWEEFDQRFELLGEIRASGIAAWRRKGHTLGAGVFLNGR
jgi:hypothetical protein